MTQATEGMMAKVRALLDKAEATTFPAEQAAYQAKAEELMRKYRIEEAQLIAKDQFAVVPGRFDIQLVKSGSAYVNHYTSIFSSIAQHTGVKVFFEWDYLPSGTYAMARGVGYKSDVEYAEMLFTQARLVFAERLEPKVLGNLSDQENVYRLRSSGMERVRIADIMWGDRSATNLSKVGRMYRAECAARGEEAILSGRGVTGAAYREQYAEQFVYKLAARLRMARDAAGQGGGGLELAGRAEKLLDYYYATFPERKPKASLPSAGGTVATQCAKCAVNKSGHCKEHPAPSYGRSNRGRDPYSVAAMRGRDAGAAAARAVNIRGTGNTESLGG